TAAPSARRDRDLEAGRPSTEAIPREDLVPATAARALGGILLVSILLRLALWTLYGDAPIHIDDEKEYNEIAVNIAERGEFAIRPWGLTSIRPPLYPALVAGVYKVTGSADFRAVRLIQVGISLMTIGLVYYLGAAIDSRRVGVWASGLY